MYFYEALYLSVIKKQMKLKTRIPEDTIEEDIRCCDPIYKLGCKLGTVVGNLLVSRVTGESRIVL